MTQNNSKLSLKLVGIIKCNILPLLFLLIVTAIAFFEVPAHEMLVTWDDQLYVTENPAIRGFSWHTSKLAFSSFYAGNYAPVQILSYMLDYTIWGESTFGYFLANVCYHFASGVLLYFLLNRLGFKMWGAAFGAALFLVHPVQVESVAWISQRKNVLAMLFYLVAFHSYLNYRYQRDRYDWTWYAVSIVMFTCSLLSKSVAVIFPLMLILYDHLDAPVRKKITEHADKLPYFAVACAVGFIALISQTPEMHGGRIDYPDRPWVTVPLTMLPVLVTYLRMLLWPNPSSLCIIYCPETRYHVDSVVLFSFIVAGGLLLIGWYLYRKKRVNLFWYLLFFLGILPVSQIIPIVTLMNDRYLYFPLIGVAGLVASGYESLQGIIKLSLYRKLFTAGMIGVIILLAMASNFRCRIWQNGITLFSDAVAKLPNERDPWTLLAESYIAKGDYVTAIKLYEKAETLGTLGNTDQFKLASIYLETGELDKAFGAIWKLLLKNNNSMDGRFLLGEYYMAKGEYNEAESHLSVFLTANPRSARGFSSLGQVMSFKGSYEKARELFVKGTKVEGSGADMYLAVTCTDIKLGKLEEAFEYLNSALQKGLSLQAFEKNKGCADSITGNPVFEPLVKQYLK